MLGGASRTCRTSPTCFHLSRGFLCRRGTENRENWHELTAFQRAREREREEFKWTWTQAKQRGDGDDRRFISSLSKKADPISPIDNTVCRTVSAEEAHQKDRKKQQKTGCGKCGPKKRYREYLYIIYIYMLYDIYIYYIHKFSRNVQQKLQIAEFEVRSLGEQEFREDVLEIVDGGIWKAKWRFPRHVWRYFHVIFLWFSVMSSHVLMFLSFFSSLSVILNLSPSVEGRFCNFVTLSFLSKNLGLLHSFWGYQNTRIPNDTNTFVDTTLVET